MKRQRILSLLICFFHVGAAFRGFTEKKTVVGQFSKDYILPCSFPPGREEVIHWIRENKIVHSYYEQSDHLEQQDPDYRSRTHLFHQSIPDGNASLKLSNLTVTDEGLYKCYVGTLESKTEVEVTLRVRVSPYYALEYQKTDTARTLVCCAFLTYPVPLISWLRGNASIQETHQEKSSNGVLYSLRSDQNIANTADPYCCHIRHPYKNWSAEWRMKEQLSVVEGSSTVIPCDYNSTTDTEGFSVAWKLHRGAVISVLAESNGTFHSFSTRAWMDQSNFSLRLDHLTAQDSGEYVCNISTSQYTKLTVRTLQVGNSNNQRNIVFIPIVVLVLCAVGVAGCCFWCKKRRRNLPENRAPTEKTEASHPLSSSSANSMEMCDLG